MSSSLRISAKVLGSLALPGSCERCFWLQMRLEGKLPFQIFPGIFNTIDSYGKRLVEGWFERHGGPPPWLVGLGKIRRFIRPPSYKTFSIVDAGTSVVLRGSPDAMFEMADGSNAIIDYKTAKFTEKQDELFPMYEGQLNAYAYIGERRGFAPVSKLALVYAEPVTDDDSVEKDSNILPDGFNLGFSATILPVEIKPDLVTGLLRKAKAILDLASPPRGTDGCEDCASLHELFKLANL